jgi:Tfp pilus assembly protein PilO
MAQSWRGSYTRYREFFLNISALYKKRADLRAFLEIILSISTVIIFLLFALKPTAITIISLLQQIREKEATLAGLNKKVNDLKTVGNLLTQNQDSLPFVNSAVPTQPVPDVLSQQTEGLAAKHGAQILAISVNQVSILGAAQAGKKTANIKPLPESSKEMPFSISVRGPYQSLLAFISDFENLRLVSKIDSLGVTASNTDAGLIIVAVISGRAPFTRL